MTSEGILLTLSVAPPFLALLVLAVIGWLQTSQREDWICRATKWSFAVTLLSSSLLGALLVAAGRAEYSLALDSWLRVGSYEFAPELVADSLSVPYAIFCSVLLFVVATFSRRYLHREPGYLRFYLLLSLFGGSVLLLVYAGSLDFAFFGWELIGLSSALLIAYFHERVTPVRHAMRAFITYRICDAGLLGAAVFLHHSAGSTAGSHVHGGADWWTFEAPAEASACLLVGLCLVWASLGKAAQFPLGGWLPRAMEGPTPSSAIFYGALSIHLGPYLLLRGAGVLAESPLVSLLVIVIGALTAMHAILVGRTQTDIKSRLAYATMAQVGVIYIEIGCGFPRLALLHILGHAALRCLQFLRAPSILMEKFELERAAQAPLSTLSFKFESRLPKRWAAWLYVGALERGHLDVLLIDVLLRHAFAPIRALDRAEQALARLLSSGPGASTTGSRAPPEVRS